MSPAEPAWDPAQYERFERLRLRPALDLIARIPPIEARRVVDLGCGAGGPTMALAERFPQAEVLGVDSSGAMLAKALTAAGRRGLTPRVSFMEQDLAAWSASEPPDVLFSNAALHWLPDHPALFARLAKSLAPGGVLAVQMPYSHDLASHRLLRETLAERAPDGQPFGSDALRARCERRPVAEPLDYRAMLAPWASVTDTWIYEYEQELEGEDAVLEWVKGSALVPVLAELEQRTPAVRTAFLECYRERLARSYLRSPDRRTRFAFPRLFVLARV